MLIKGKKSVFVILFWDISGIYFKLNVDHQIRSVAQCLSRLTSQRKVLRANPQKKKKLLHVALLQGH